MAIQETTPLTLRALEVAITQLGQQEDPAGSNRGPMVDKYLRSVGLNPGYAWCQAFVYWCYATAAAATGTKCPVIRTAGVRDCWNKTPLSQRLSRKEAVTDTTTIKPGYQFIMLFAGGNGHTGIVERVEGTYIHTIEGNSNNTGSREGTAVVRHIRSITDPALQGFIMYDSGL